MGSPDQEKSVAVVDELAAENDTSPKMAAAKLKGASSLSKDGGASTAMKGKGVVSNVTFHYFDMNGRADPIRQMFEYHG